MRILHFLVQQYCPPPLRCKVSCQVRRLFPDPWGIAFPVFVPCGLRRQARNLYRAQGFTPKITQQEKRIQSRSNQKTTQKILTAMKGNPNITISELSKICEITVDGVKWQLKSLTKSGHISRIGGDRGGHWEVLE